MADEKMFDVPQMNAAVTNMQKVLLQNSDFRGGREAIMTNKENYISKLSEQDDPQYKAMVEMAPVYILYPRVVDGFVGTVFAKSPILEGVEFDDKMIEQNKNVDLLGNSLDKYSEVIVKNVMENGFCGTMNDYSKQLNRPFLRFIKPEQFVTFRTNSDDGYPKFEQFIFKETIEIADDDNEFDSVIKDQYTVLDLAPNPKNKNKFNYRVRIFLTVTVKDVLKGTASEKMVLKSENFPIKNTKYFDSIPIKIHGVESNNFTVEKSLIQDISDMNVSVFQRTVDQVYMLHWTALPTPWTTGCDSDEAPTTIGPSKVWHIENPDAKVGMLEFTGSSARAHQDFIENLLYIMATTGAQILKKEGVSRETATSVLVRTGQQTSLISTMVKNTSGQIQDSLEVYLDWSKVTTTKEFNYKLNDDFIKVDMEPNAQIALVKSWLDGVISHETVFDKMKEGELIKANRTFDDELAAIKKNPPPFFKEEVDAENAKGLAEMAAKSAEKAAKLSGAGQQEKDTKGSSLETGNGTQNPLATE